MQLNNDIVMDNIEEYREEIYKCSKCGLCKSVCPVFLATKNEMFLPRGRYIILNRFFNNKEKLSKNFIKNLDICLNCNKCKEFCPSNIDSYRIYTCLKFVYKKFNFFSFAFLFYISLNLIKLPAYLFRIMNFYPCKIFEILLKHNVKRKPQKNITTKKVVYFEGCINKYLNPSDKNATINLLEKNGYKIEKIISLCCGYPYLSDGNVKKFIKNSQKIINSIPKDCEYIVCSCDSCFETLNRIDVYLPNINNFKNKLITLDGLFYDIALNEDVLYHKPLIRENELLSSKKLKIINKKENASLMENFILFRNVDNKIKQEMLNNIFYNKEQLEGKTVITTCLLSKLGLLIGFYLKKINAKVYMYSEFIELNENNKKKLTNNL